MAFYVIDENHNMVEAYDKEGVLAVLDKAIKDGSLEGITADAGFINKIKCCVTGQANRVAFVTQAKYNELVASGSIVPNCLYYITDENTSEHIDAQLEWLTEQVEHYGEMLNDLTAYTNGIKNGNSVPNAERAESAESATNANRAELAVKMTMTDIITPNSDGNIKIESEGAYLVCIRSVETGGSVRCVTDLIIVGGLDIYNLSVNFNDTSKPSVTYDKDSRSLKPKVLSGQTNTLSWAKKIM